MNPDKRIIIDELLARVNASSFVIVFDYTTITVPQFSQIRQELDACGAQCHVAKNNFMSKVFAEANLPQVDEVLVGQTAFVTGESDVVGAAKVLNEFIKKNKKGSIRIGILDNAILSAAQVVELGNLPSRETLLAMLLGTINGAASALARVIQAHVDQENGDSAE